MPFDIDRMPDEHSLVALLDLRTVTGIVDPLSSPPWEDVETPITREEILHAIANEDFVTTPLNEGMSIAPSERRSAHVARIAFLALHPSEDAIVLAIGASSDVGPSVLDGHHRIAAAIIRQTLGMSDETRILVTFDGYLDVAMELFPDGEFFSIPIEDEPSTILSR